MLKSFVFLILFLSAKTSFANCASNVTDINSIDLRCIQSPKYQSLLSKVEKREEKRQKALDKALKLQEEAVTTPEKNKISKKVILAKRKLNLQLILKNKDDASKLKNKFYFFKTGAGHLGKMVIKNATVTPLKCSMYVEVTTYQGRDVINKSITFVTKNVSNAWNVDRASFDNKPGSDFSLSREYGLCVFKSINGVIAPIGELKEVEDQNGSEILVYAALFLIGLAVFLVARTVFQDEDRFKAQERLEDAEQEEKEAAPNDIVLKYSRPFFKRYFSPIVAGMKNKRKIREKYKRPLASSGMNKFLTPEDFYAFKLFLIIGFPIVYLGLRSFLEEDWPLAYTPLVSVFGFFYPDIWIKGKKEQRQKDILENMPFVVDMLALSVEAGLDFIAAMQKVIEKAPHSALVEEFETLIKETKIGSSRADGLRQLSWRVDILPVSSFCATLIAADSVGANIGPILKTLANELREKRSAMVEQKGAQASTKILIPMIFLVLPAVLLIIAAPIGLQLING